MYTDPKHNRTTRVSQIFLGLSVVILMFAIALGLFISRDGGASFRDLISGSDDPFALGQ